MKKFTALLLCMVLALSAFGVNAAAAETGIEAKAELSDGIVTLTVTAAEPVANAELHVAFDSDYLTYVDYETDFTIHTPKAEEELVTIGLANSSTSKLEKLAVIRFRVTGAWDETAITVNGETVTVEGPGCRFVDVPVGEWFYEAVDRMAAEGYIKGISATHFGPALNMNRASFVTLLGRLNGNADTNAETVFVDVPYDSFYSGHVAWAAENGITSGVDATHFNPTGDINRAQMVAFLYRYAKYKGEDVTVQSMEVLNDFADGAEVAAIDWAAEPFAWAVENGIINGMEGSLNPDGTANRAQVAVMLYRYFFEG